MSVIIRSTDSTNEAVVTASGELKVAVTTNSASTSVTADTELPAAAALADAAANPTTPTVGADNQVFNGSTWDRARSADTAATTTGTGLAGAGMLGHDGTNWQRAGLLVGDSGQNQQLVAGGRKEVTFTTTTAQAVAATDASNYRWVSVQIATQGTSSTVTFQGCNDNTNWVSIGLFSSTSTAGPATQSTTGTGIWHGPVACRYVRLNVTAISAGTTSGTIEFFALPTAVQGIGVDTELPAAATSADAATNPSAPMVQAAGQVFNGTTWDRARSATSVAGTTGTGTPAAGILGFDGTNFQRVKTDASGNVSVNVANTPAVTVSGTVTTDTEMPAAAALADATTNPTTPVLGAANEAFNGTTWDRARTATAASATTGTGVPAAGVLGFDGTNYQRLKTDTSGQAAVNVQNFPATQPVSLAAAVPVTDNSGSLTVDDGGGSLTVDGAVTVSGTATVSGTVTADTEMPAAAALADATTNPTTPIVGAANEAFNGTTWDRARTANAAAATTGTGVPAAGMLGFDGTNYQRVASNTTGQLGTYLVDKTNAAQTAQVSVFGSLSVALDPAPVFADTFEGATFDTTVRWNTYGSVAATQSQGSLSVNPGTTASATVAVASQPTVTINTTMAIGGTMTLEATTIATGNHRFFGFGTAPSNVGTAAAPLTDAVGFEIDTAGVLRASVYANGTRVSTTALTVPTDGGRHIYLIYARGDVAFFYLDSTDVPVASSFLGPASQVLPLRAHSLNSGTVTGTPTMVLGALALLDAFRTANAIADPTYPWRKAAVTAGGALTTTSATSSTAALASVAAATSSTTLLAANANRKAAIIWNESSATLYVALGASVSTTSYTWQVQPGGYLELPTLWVGALTGVWSAATGNARTTDVS